MPTASPRVSAEAAPASSTLAPFRQEYRQDASGSSSGRSNLVDVLKVRNLDEGRRSSSSTPEQTGEGSNRQQQWGVLKQRLADEGQYNAVKMRASKPAVSDNEHSHDFSGDSLVRLALADDGWIFGHGMQALQQQSEGDEGHGDGRKDQGAPLEQNGRTVYPVVETAEVNPPGALVNTDGAEGSSSQQLGTANQNTSHQDASNGKMGLQLARDLQESAPAMTTASNGAGGLTRDGSIARTNAIAMLKRAASQREIRNRSPGPRLIFHDQSGQNGPATGSSSPATFDTAAMGEERGTPIATDLLDIRYVTTPGGDSFFPVQASRPISPSQARSNSRGGDTCNGLLGANLSRSASRLGASGNKSPLPSLEQLRARILQERTTAGLARSASTSAASAAARQYAMEKLLGTSFREGAVSPVSDTAEEQEQENKRLSVVKDTRPLLRRSRTIGGLSASAEAQRKAAFVEALDKGIPSDAGSAQRGSRRFAHGPLHKGQEAASDTQEIVHSESTLQRNASQRQVARTEMLRKLSTRKGAASPASTMLQQSPIVIEQRDESLQAASDLVRAPAPVLHSQSSDSPSDTFSANQSFERASKSGLLGIPRANKPTFSPASRSSAGFQHDADRNRASEVARFNNEEAFEYEKLLELGYSTDDAWDRIASARKSVHVQDPGVTSMSHGSSNGAPAPLQLYAVQLAQNHGLASRMTAEDAQYASAASHDVYEQRATSPQAEELLAKHPSAASIPLGLDASVMTHGGRSASSEERLDTPNGYLYAQTSPYPESILASPTASTLNAKHDSSATQPLMETGETNRSRIEALLSPGFLTEIGNPLDYSNSPVRTPQRYDGRAMEPSHSRDDDVRNGESQGSFASAPSNGSMSSYLDNVGRMADQLGVFTRQAQRSARDATVLNSSAAQVEAAAQDYARYQELTPTSSIAGGNSRLGSAAASPELSRAQLGLNPFDAIGNTGSPLKTSTLPEQEPAQAATAPRAANNASKYTHPSHNRSGSMARGEAGDPYSHLYLANSKLAPFPALLVQDGSLGPMKASTAPIASPPSKGASNGKTHGRDLSIGKSSGTSKETFFSSLRRKASRGGSKQPADKTASPNIDQNVEQVQERPMSPARIFSNILTRRPSKKDNVNSSNGNGSASHWRSGSTSKLRPSAAVPLGEIFHITAPDTATRPVPNSPGQHSRNISASSTATTRNMLDSSMLDRGQAISPVKRQPPTNGLAPSAADAFNRYSRALTSSAHPNTYEPAGIPGISNEQINKPPRDYVMSSPILQVVGVTSIKDRFAFLFTDLIVIAKPLHPPASQQKNGTADELPTLAWTFTVKSVIELDGLRLTVPKSEQKHTRQQTPMLAQFVEEFSMSPQDAITRVVQSSGLPYTPATIAQFLQQTPGLDRQQLSDFLFTAKDDGALICEYVQMEKFAGVSIESALRSLLIELRFPRSRDALQVLLTAFARRWTETNAKLIKDNFTPQLAIDLVFAIMGLNDALHARTGSAPGYFASSYPTLSRDDFVSSFRVMDAQCVLSDRTLLRIYGSVSTDPLQQAIHPSEAAQVRTISIDAPGLPTRLTYGIVSDHISVSIPRVDPDFAIRLYGEGLTFQPQILSFEKSARQEFRILSKELGLRTVVFIRAGRNARLYQSPLASLKPTDFALPRSFNITVQRAFMKHCFTVTLPDERRFLLSVASSDQQQAWTRAVKDLTELRQRSIAAGTVWATGNPHALSLHVLQEALIERDEPEQDALQRSASNATTGSQQTDLLPSSGLLRSGSTKQQKTSTGSNAQRKDSVSKHYYARSRPGHRERELMRDDGPLLEELPEPNDEPRNGASSPKIYTGEELIMTVRQNSLLPLVVAHAQRAAES